MKRILFVFLLALLGLSFCQPVLAFSINVVDGDVCEVLRSTARIGKLNVILDDSVQGNVTVAIKNMSPEDAIRYIALARGLSFVQENGTIIVSNRSAIEAGFGSVHVFPLKYGNSEDILSAVKLQADGIKLWADSSANALLMYGTNSQAEDARRIIDKLDVPSPQVSLEAKIVSVEKNTAKKMGISFDGLNLETRNSDKLHAKAVLDALSRDGRADVLSRPNIMTVQGREAVINIGGEVPIPTNSVTNSTTTNSFTYRQTGIILRYTPYVNDDGYITAKVHTEISTPSYVEEMGAYKFSNRSADTVVRLKDGETMVIGGLIGKEETKSFSKVPFLSEIPILGKLFTYKNNSSTENEIVIFLTAKLV